MNGVADGKGVFECLLPLFKLGQACFEPTSVNHDNTFKSNCSHLVVINNGIDNEALESNEHIQLMNMFDFLLSEDNISSTRKVRLMNNSSSLLIKRNLLSWVYPRPLIILLQNLSPKVNLEDLKQKVC